MYLTRLHVKNVKLMRSLSLDFTHENRPRMWTVFVAEGGACKTTLLQAIALTASGADRASALAEVASLPDLRRPGEPVRISADFEFGTRLEKWRRFPEPNLFAKSRDTLRLRSSLGLKPGQTDFSGDSWFAPREVMASVQDEAPQLNAEALLTAFRERSQAGGAHPRHSAMGRLSGSESTFFWQMLSYAFTRRDQMSEARTKGMPGWFVAGYGTERHLLAPPGMSELKDRVLTRLEPLFGRVSPMGTGFANPFADTPMLEPFLQALRQVLVDNQLLPYVQGVELSGRGGVLQPGALFRSHSLTFSLALQETRVPAHWLSQAYQSTIAWVADFIGQMYLDVGRPVPLEDMEGLVLIDEPDLHLPPAWQVRLVPVLKRLFPRMQFIVTTHSPVLLSALERHEVVMLRVDEQGDIVAEPPPLYPSPGVDDEVGEGLRRYTWLSSNPNRTEEEDAEMWRLRTKLSEGGLDLGLPPVPREQQRPA